MEKVKGENLYQIKVTLIVRKPPIWRRLIVPRTIRLDKLHLVIQKAMGWENYHLYSFEKGQHKSYQDLTGYSRNDLSDGHIGDSSKKTLDKLLCTNGDKITYEYDFGISWEHRILLEKSSLPGQEFPHIPICIKGKGTCPAEDGNFGLVQNLTELDEYEDESGCSREELVKNFLSNFDVRKYDLDSINQRLINLSTQNSE